MSKILPTGLLHVRTSNSHLSIKNYQVPTVPCVPYKTISRSVRSKEREWRKDFMVVLFYLLLLWRMKKKQVTYARLLTAAV